MSNEILKVTPDDFELLANEWNNSHDEKNQKTPGDMRRLYNQGVIWESDIRSARELQERRAPYDSAQTENNDTLEG